MEQGEEGKGRERTGLHEVGREPQRARVRKKREAQGWAEVICCLSGVRHCFLLFKYNQYITLYQLQVYNTDSVHLYITPVALF